jgi:hypothetical protein
MSGRPEPGEALEVVRGLLGGDQERAAGTFMRGLTLGALIGAAIAGSAIWQRRGKRDHAGTVHEETGIAVGAARSRSGR